MFSGLYWVYLIKKLGISCIELQRELPEAMGQRWQVDFV